MHIVEKNIELESLIGEAKKEGRTLGFVATMGALHAGHVALMKKAKQENDILIVSIFVNPAQFNRRADFQSYPKTFAHDVETLKEVDCDILFYPSENQIYPNGVKMVSVDFKGLDDIMEGEFRPGHFLGMVTVVDRFFELIKPSKAYFGEKDYQQYLIVKQLALERHPYVEVVPCEIVREDSGFAMSSRNQRLTKEGYHIALNIPRCLKKVSQLRNTMSPAEVENTVKSEFNSIAGIQLEYFHIVDAELLTTSLKWTNSYHRVFIAANVGDVRLIDNMLI